MLKDLHGRLRPMSFSDMLDETTEIYKSNFVLLAGVAGAIYVPYAIISGLLERPGEASAAAYIGTAVDMLIAFVISSIITGALTFAISERYLSREATVGGSYKRVFSRDVFWRLFGAVVLKTIIVVAPMGVPAGLIVLVAGVSALGGGVESGPMLAVVLVGVLFMMIGALFTMVLAVKLTLVESSVLLEHCSVGRAISRSWQLLNGYFWQSLALILVVGIITSLVAGVITGPATVMVMMKTARSLPVGWGLRVINVVLTGIAHILTTPIMSSVIILLYYDLRIRKEGFDLQLLAQELDEKSQAFAATGVSSLPQEAPVPAVEQPQVVQPPVEEGNS